jgi:acetyltransferase
MPLSQAPFPWHDFVSGEGVVTEDVVTRILESAGLKVAPGRIARTAEDAARTAAEVGFNVAMKAISPAITHRAAVGLVALDIATEAAAAETFTAFQARAAALSASLDGVWVQHMFRGSIELLVTAFRDPEFGVIVGCGMGGGLTEVIDDVLFARAPIDTNGAEDLLRRLRTLRRLPALVSDLQLRLAAGFIADFSALVASAPWQTFTLEVNPLKLGQTDIAAVDGLLIVG